jgi:hypothetical protein
MDVVCLFTTVSIPDDLMSVWKDRVSILYKLKLCHKMEGEWVWYGILVLEI